MTDEELIDRAMGSLDVAKGEATDEETAAAVAEIAAERGDEDRSGE